MWGGVWLVCTIECLLVGTHPLAVQTIPVVLLSLSLSLCVCVVK